MTIKDKEHLYHKLINEQHDLSDRAIDHLYKNLLTWLDDGNPIIQEILDWYNDNGYPFLSFHIFSQLCVCAIYKLRSPGCPNQRELTDTLLVSIFRVLHLESWEKYTDSFFDECILIFKDDCAIQKHIFRVINTVKKQNPPHRAVGQGHFSSFTLLFDVMCRHVHVLPEKAPASHMIDRDEYTSRIPWQKWRG